MGKLFDDFDIGDLVCYKLGDKVTGIVIDYDWYDYPASGIRKTGIKVKWYKSRNKTIREIWYNKFNLTHLKHISILAKAKGNPDNYMDHPESNQQGLHKKD